MNVLILGKNEKNPVVEKALSGCGVDSRIVEDVSLILKFKGEPGAFTVTTPDGEHCFTSVIVTEPPRFRAPTADGETTVNLMNGDEVLRLDNPKASEKIVILLDYADEAPEYMAAKAISAAKWLSDRKKNVIFLSKTVKSGFDGGEESYREARNAGVVFVKYDALSLGYDEEKDVFAIEANDGVFTINIETPYVVSAAAETTPELEAIAKKLRLFKREDGRINEDRYFMYPVFSSKGGIYYAGLALAGPDEGKSAGEAISRIIEDMKAQATDGYVREIVRGEQFPEVDPGKCAFCYSCYRACPHGALEPDMDASAMKVIEASCQACGICIAICPGEAIARKGAVPRQSGGGRRKIYCCENGAMDAFESILPSLGDYGQTIDCERIACGGSVSTDMLTTDLARYDTVIVACCVEDACRHMNGDKRACKQARRAAELFQKANIAGKRVEVIKASHAMQDVLRDNILSVLEG